MFDILRYEWAVWKHIKTYQSVKITRGRGCYHSHETTSGCGSFDLFAGEIVVIFVHGSYMNLMLRRLWKLEIRIMNKKKGSLGISLEV
jgi:hypothetical protein